MTRGEIAVHIRTHLFLMALLDVRAFLLLVLSADEKTAVVFRPYLSRSSLVAKVIPVASQHSNSR
jgi:hypothetical protein